MDRANQLDYASGEPIPASALRELLVLAIPTIAQMASYTLMQFFDAWMLARAAGGNVDGTTAVGMAGLLAFSFISFGMGVLWVVNTLVSQSYGRGDHLACGRYLWQGVWFAFAFAALLWLVIPLLGPMFRVMGHEAALVEMEQTYVRIVLGWSILKLLGAAFSQFLLAIDRAALVFSATFIGVSANAVAAFVMVFGKFGVPRLGVVGTAWAQNIGVAVESGCLIGFACLPTIRRAFNLRDWKFRKPEMLTLVRVGSPSGGQVTADVLAWSLFCLWVMAPLGKPAMEANNLAMLYMKVSFMPAYGISVAVTALVGRYIGRGEPDIAERRAHLGFKLTAVYMLICGLLFFVFRRQAMGCFTHDPAVLKIGSMLMIFAAVYQFFDAVYIAYNGALRGAGDTFVPAVATAILCWGITVLCSYFVAWYWPQLGAAGPWTLATIYGAIVGVFIYLRFSRGQWRLIHLKPGNSNHPDNSDTLVTTG